MSDHIIEQVMTLDGLEPPFDAAALALIRDGLASEHPAVVLRAVGCVERGCVDELVPDLLEQLLARGGAVANAVLRAAERHPALAFEPRPIFDAADRQRARFHHGIEQHFTEGVIGALSGSLARGLQRARSLPPDAWETLLRGVAALPGLPTLDASALAGLEPDERTLVQSERDALVARRFPRQITLNLTYRCDLNCPYCFAAGMQELIPDDMPLDLVQRYVDLAVADGCAMVGLLGGEPLLAPYLPELCAYAVERGVQVAFSTNLLSYHTVAHRLPPEAIRAVTVHIEKPDFYTPERWAQMQANLRLLADQSLDTILRYNFTDPDCRDWDFLVEAAALFDDPVVSCSYTFPPESGRGSFTPLDRILTLKDKLMAFVDRFGEQGVPVFLAKPYPLCAFDRHELRRVLDRGSLKNICEIARNDGTNNLLIRNDGRFQLCMAIPEPVLPVDPAVDSLATLSARGARHIDALIRTPVLEECADCMLFLRGVCQGVCYAYLTTEGEG